MNKNWKIEDIIDIDHYSKADMLNTASAASLHQRDRDWYLQAAGATPDERLSQSRCLLVWLERMRRLHSGREEREPGALLAGALAILRLTLIIVALLSGIGAGLSYFAYTGTAALNIFSFLALFVLPQLLLVMLFLLRGFLARIGGKGWADIQKMLPSLLMFIKRKLGDRGSSLDTASLKEMKLLRPRLLTFSQLFGVIFNAALLGVTLFKVATSDLAFGWQTTLQVGPEKLFSLVRTVAFPWAWILPEGIAYPTLTDIEGSRIILKDGILDLATENLVSWWPFLLLCLLFYGLLPRILLLISALLLERRHLRAFMQKEDFQQIHRRMRTPVVTTQAEHEPDQGIVHRQPITTERVTADTVPGHAQRDAILLVPAEIVENLDDHSLPAALAEQGFEILEVQPIFTDFSRDTGLLARLRAEQKPLIILIEAWMAPIGEHLGFLKDAAQTAAPRGQTHFILLGKPDASALLTGANRQDTEIWKSQLTRLISDASFLTLELTDRGGT